MKSDNQRPIWRSTTILSVRKDGVVALGGDGQVSYGNTIMKSDTKFKPVVLAQSFSRGGFSSTISLLLEKCMIVTNVLHVACRF